jgi:hypothetical protein
MATTTTTAKNTKQLAETYYDPRRGFGGAQALQRALKKRQRLHSVQQWLSGQDAYTLHRPVRYRFKRLRTIVGDIDQQFQADLADMRNIQRHNDHYKYILTCIDVLSRYAWALPLKNKSATTVRDALEQIFSERRPKTLQTDKGTEFKNAIVQAFLRQQGVRFFTSESPDVKAALVERFNRTLKEKMYRYFTHANTLRYLPILADLVHNYNHSYHRSIKMAPAAVTHRNKARVLKTLYGSINRRRRPLKNYKFKSGDHVRISKGKIVFKKGYLPGWTEEIFVVDKRLTDQQRYIPVYRLRDLQGEQVKGTFYEQELQKVQPKTADDLQQIERVVQSRGKGSAKEHLVKWKGYPDKFNSWIKAADIEQI